MTDRHLQDDPGVRVSVIVPAHNAERTLPACLRALRDGDGPAAEVIVVDDRSTDGTAEIARTLGARIAPSPAPGPAAARNAGALLARGEILVFVDSDVAVRSDTLRRIIAAMEADPKVAAVFGSYDDEPSDPNFLSQFKNLQHHFVHQNSPSQAMTFWAGCGAIRKSVFDAVGGFQAERFPHPSIEDIELGLRLWKSGYGVRLEPSIQAKHLKHWSLLSLLHTEIFRRALPWSQLILESGIVPKQLNLTNDSRRSAQLVLAFLTVGVLLVLGHAQVATLHPRAVLLLWLVPGALLSGAVAINQTFYRFLKGKRGSFFAARAVLWHLFYYFYSSVTFASCWLSHQVARVRLQPR